MLGYGITPFQTAVTGITALSAVPLGALSYTVPFGFTGDLFDWDPNLDDPFTMEVVSGDVDLTFNPDTGMVSTSVAFTSLEVRTILLAAYGSGGTPRVELPITFTAESSGSTPAPSWSVLPSISGTAQVGQTLTGNDGTIADGIVSGRQWYADGVAISGATGTTLALTGAHYGKAITYEVSATGDGGSASEESAPTSDVAALGPVAAPTLTGNPALFVSLDPADTSKITFDGNGRVASIAGSDGTSLSFTGASNNGSALPAVTVVNGVQTIDFVETNQQYLSRADGSGVSTHSSTGRCTIVAIYERTDASSTTASIISIGQGTQTATINQLLLMVSATGYLTRKAGPSSNVTVTQGAQDQVRHCHIGVMAAGNSSPVAYLDGGAGGTGGAANWPTILDYTKIGARTTGGTTGGFVSMHLCRVLIYDAALTSTQAEEIAAWAALHYGTVNA